MNRKSKGIRQEAMRFIIVGTVVTAIQYGTYYLIMNRINVSVAWTIAYLISFICNFVMTTYFTFHVKPSKRKAVGFTLSHIVNWAFQTGFLNLFIYIGMSKAIAPIPMYMICMPVNFMLVRFFMKNQKLNLPRLNTK